MTDDRWQFSWERNACSMKIFNKINYYIYNIYIIYIVKFYFPYLPHVSENCHLSSVIVLTFLPDAFNRVQFDTFRTEAGLNRFVMTPFQMDWPEPALRQLHGSRWRYPNGHDGRARRHFLQRLRHHRVSRSVGEPEIAFIESMIRPME